MDTCSNVKNDEIQTGDKSDPNCVSHMVPDPKKQAGNAFSVSSSQRGLLEISGSLDKQEIKATTPKKSKRRFSRYLLRPPKRAGFLKLGSPTFLVSPSAKFRRIADQRDGLSRATQTPQPLRGLKDGFNMPYVGEIRWVVLKGVLKKWLRNPKNLALFIWGGAVAVSGAILFLVMVGFLNGALPKKSQRNAWFEVNNQILNALFTMMCLYLHPLRFYHLSLLCRWEPQDIIKLRKIYCKNGTYKPHEWMHIMVVVLLLHLNCFAQYALCGLNWGYKRSDRPAIGVGLCLAFSIGAPAAAGIYVIASPLGKDYETKDDLEAGVVTNAEQNQSDLNSVDGKRLTSLLERRYSFSCRESKRVESKPEWKGGLFDCWTDLPLLFFSTFALFCVFGWNMDRLGFGNMYVHTVTFILLCMAPFWIFNLAAINIDNEQVREGLGITGIILCVFGLLYGGFWRVQMRKRFGLPGNYWCFGQPTLTDFMQWLFCSVCSLSQEVRTGDFYDVSNENSIPKASDVGDASLVLVPLSHEPGSAAYIQPFTSPHSLSSGQPPFSGQGSASPIQSAMYSAGSLQNEASWQEELDIYASPSPVRGIHLSGSSALITEDAQSEVDQTGNSNAEVDPMSAPIPLHVQRE